VDYPENLVPITVPEGWLELRIHGVSGTPPEDLLRGEPVRVSGNDLSGFYRINGVDDLEAYSWGGLTSGKKRHAFWLLLLPFSLLNVAGWMTPCPLSDVPKRIHAALTRGLALTATGMTTLFATVLIMDLGAWRPPNAPDNPGWLAPSASERTPIARSRRCISCYRSVFSRLRERSWHCPGLASLKNPISELILATRSKGATFKFDAEVNVELSIRYSAPNSDPDVLRLQSSKKFKPRRSKIGDLA